MKKIGKRLLIVLLLFVLYLIAGVILAYRRQPEVSREYQEAFRAADCYSDTVSGDRAYIIEENTEALARRLELIAHAKERIILSTFEFRADESGKDIIAALIQAAERGVEVKILVDGAAAILQMDRNNYFYALSTAENVEIKIYNRINLLKPWTTMGRLHDKYVIADDALYLLGGRNTYDYFLGDNGYKNYDRDVLVYTAEPENAESSIHQLEEYFASVWELDVCRYFYRHPENAGKTQIAEAREELAERYARLTEEYGLDGAAPDYVKMTAEVNRITLLSNPIHVSAKEPTAFYSLVQLMKEAEGPIKIHTPYIICNDWMYQCLREICEANPETMLMTNSVANNGNPFGASDYRKNKERILQTGLNVYEYEGGVSYHGKSITIGEELAVIGSLNMDMRSVYLDTELMLVIHSQEINRRLRGYMESYEKDAVKALPDGAYEIPDGVERQELGGQRAWRVNVLSLFNWFRFLM